MAFGLKLIGELQYGLGIAFILLVVIFTFIITPYEKDEFYHVNQVDMNELNKALAVNGFTPQQQLEMDVLIGISYDTQIGNYNSFKYTFGALSIGFVVLGFFMVMQGIANIKLHREHSKKK